MCVYECVCVQFVKVTCLRDFSMLLLVTATGTCIEHSLCIRCCCSENFAWTAVFISPNEVSVVIRSHFQIKTLGHREVQGLLFTQRGSGALRTRYLLA